MGEHYTEFLEKALNETAAVHEKLVLKLGKAIEELEQCRIDLFEAEDKFHVLSFYINDKQAHDCAKDRSNWMGKSSQRVKETLEGLNK